MRVGGQCHIPAASPPGNRPSTHCTEGLVDLKTSKIYRYCHKYIMAHTAVYLFSFELNASITVAARTAQGLGYRLHTWRVWLRGRKETYLFSKASQTALKHTQPPMHLVPQTLSQAVKQPRYEDDHSSIPNTKVKNVWTGAIPLLLHIP
jgi:hypothetical protein